VEEISQHIFVLEILIEGEEYGILCQREIKLSADGVVYVFVRLTELQLLGFCTVR
jgi:hypothetical protein